MFKKKRLSEMENANEDLPTSTTNTNISLLVPNADPQLEVSYFSDSEVEDEQENLSKAQELSTPTPQQHLLMEELMVTLEEQNTDFNSFSSTTLYPTLPMFNTSTSNQTLLTTISTTLTSCQNQTLTAFSSL